MKKCIDCQKDTSDLFNSLCRNCLLIKVVRQALSERSNKRDNLTPLLGQLRGSKRTPVPTKALPGTSEKIEVLRERVEHGFYLWHPKDATLDDMTFDYKTLMRRKKRHKKTSEKKVQVITETLREGTSISPLALQEESA